MLKNLLSDINKNMVKNSQKILNKAKNNQNKNLINIFLKTLSNIKEIEAEAQSIYKNHYKEDKYLIIAILESPHFREHLKIKYLNLVVCNYKYNNPQLLKDNALIKIEFKKRYKIIEYNYKNQEVFKKALDVQSLKY